MTKCGHVNLVTVKRKGPLKRRAFLIKMAKPTLASDL